MSLGKKSERTDEGEAEPQDDVGEMEDDTPRARCEPPEDGEVGAQGTIVGCKYPDEEAMSWINYCERCDEFQQILDEDCPKDKKADDRDKKLVRRVYRCPKCKSTNTDEYELTEGTWTCYDCDCEFLPEKLTMAKELYPKINAIEDDIDLLVETMMDARTTTALDSLDETRRELLNSKANLKELVYDE